MTEEEVKKFLKEKTEVLGEISERAHSIHDAVNQTYESYPYGYHLDRVTGAVIDYLAPVCTDEEDILPVIFGSYFHDSIEDARLTYSDVKNEALKFFSEEKALLATEIVYALTNEKGRTREERAGERYYSLIRETPYAPFVKACDRFANMNHSFWKEDKFDLKMRKVYSDEMEHFLQGVTSPHAESDPRFSIPEELIQKMNDLVKG